MGRPSSPHSSPFSLRFIIHFSYCLQCSLRCKFSQVFTCAHVCVHLFVCMYVSRDEAGRDSAGFAPAHVLFGGVACEADRLSWRETGQLSRETRMDRVGSGVVDGMAGREWWSQSLACSSNEGATLRGGLSHYCLSNCHPLEHSGSLQIPEQFIPHFCWKKNEKSYTGRNK